jgi:hypothetical protein
VFHYFGPSAAVGGSNFDEGFGVELNSMGSSAFKMSARELAARPDDLLSEHEEQLNRTLGQSAAIFLAEEPGLNELVAEVTHRLSQARNTMYRHQNGPESLNQVAIIMFMLAHSTFTLWVWLTKQATDVKPAPELQSRADTRESSEEDDERPWWRRMFGG